MTYRYACRRGDDSDLASGWVPRSAPRMLGFPVRLTSESFQRAAATAPAPHPVGSVLRQWLSVTRMAPRWHSTGKTLPAPLSTRSHTATTPGRRTATSSASANPDRPSNGRRCGTAATANCVVDVAPEPGLFGIAPMPSHMFEIKQPWAAGWIDTNRSLTR